MIKLENLDLILEDQVVIENINFYFGHEAYLLSGHMYKRKSKLLEEIAKAYAVYNPNIAYSNETGVVYLPNYRILIENLTVKQNLEFFANFFGAPLVKTRVISNHFGFDNYLNRTINSLSSDLNQLVRIACVCLNINASVYIFDNIFDHLNKTQISLVKDYLKLFVKDSIFIFSKLNTHELEEFKPRVVNIEKKRLVYEVKR